MTSSIHSSFSTRFAQRLVQALGFALCAWLAPSIAGAQDTDGGAATSLAAAPASQESAVIEIPVAPIIIESDLPAPQPTLEQLMLKFREALGQPPSFVVSEHQLADGALELTTRFGRFCARPLPAQSQFGVGGHITLAAPCAHL